MAPSPQSEGTAMFAIAAVSTVLTLGAMNWAIWRKPAGGRFSVAESLVIVAVGGALFFCLSSPLMSVQLVMTLVGTLAMYLPRRGRGIASGFSVLAFAAVWGAMASLVVTHWREVDDLREAYPFVSMEERLPEPPPAANVNEERLTDFEETIQALEANRWGRYPPFEELHSEHVKDFGDMPGFGGIRMIRPAMTKSIIRRQTTLPEPIPQPGAVPDGLDPTGDAWPDAKLRELFGFHLGSVGEFVNARGFGYLKSRRAVSGFAPHAFKAEPKPALPYTLERLELVGLVLHAEPAVYVSEFLPRMDELGRLVTRPADGFEAAGLLKLAAGDDLTASAAGRKVRLLGAIRSTSQCVACHGGRRGDLLGAFSYRLAETAEAPR